MAGLSGYTYNTLVQAIKDYTEVGSNVFTETILDFIIVGFTIFIVVKFVNKLKTKANDVKDMTVATPADVQLLSDIKELLKIQNHKLSK